MRESRGWARASSQDAHGLRRGAWYEIVGSSSDPDFVVLDVARRNVAVRRDSLEIEQERPDRFSVVTGPGDDPDGQADAPAFPYAVCPACSTRVELPEGATKLKCPRCLHSGVVGG